MIFLAKIFQGLTLLAGTLLQAISPLKNMIKSWAGAGPKTWQVEELAVCTRVLF